jgi:D-alanyl-D-alanine carboxypeptidase (penicillin-binding protein 5/6)
MYMRKLSLFVSFCLFFGLFAGLRPVSASYRPPDSVQINSRAVYLYNLDAETRVFEQEAQTRMAPASLAKIMTCILALENTDDLEEEIEFPSYIWNMVEPGASQADVRQGEILTMRKALYCLMLQSDCYSALAIADKVGDGDIQAFVDMMNDKAALIGAQNTYFTNPHGLYDEGMYTTAYDMFLIARYAIKLDNFMDIASTYTIDISPTNKEVHASKYNLFSTIYPMYPGNTYYYEPIKGIKTGTLDEVGRNFVSMASKDGYNYLLVLMGAPNRDATGEPLQENLSFIDAKNIYEWAFNEFETKQLLEKGKTCNSVPVRLSKEADTVNLLAAESFSALVPKGIEVDAESGLSVMLRYTKPDSIDAPVSRGKKIGTVDLMLNNEVLGTVDLLAEKDIPRSQTLYMLDYLKGFFDQLWIKFVLVLVILILGFYITLMVLRNRYRKRYRRARGRKR